MRKVMVCCDIERLLSNDAFSVYRHCMYKPTYEKYRDVMGALVDDPRVKEFICEDNGVIIGMLTLKEEVNKAEIVGISVLEEYRRQNVAREMIQHAIAEEGLRTVFAQTDGEAVGFYRRCGFAAEEVLIEYPDGACIRYNCELKC